MCDCEQKTKRFVSDCEIVEQVEIGSGVFRSILKDPNIAAASLPGQFVNVKTAEGFDPLLRRPFSVHAVDPENGTFALLYDVVGRGTKLLKAMHKGDVVSIVGPLGSAFDIGNDPNAYHVLVAGGCGAAPIHFLSDYICRKHGCSNVTVLVGAKAKDAVLCYREFTAHGVEVQTATEDGSFGFQGLVTELLESHLKTLEGTIRVYSCGPMAMMKEVARICKDMRVGCCQLSLETVMACGMGVCMGCVVKTHSKNKDGWSYSRVCTDGPVFNAEEINWE